MNDRTASTADSDALAAAYVRYSEIHGQRVPEDTPEMDADERAYSVVDGAMRTAAPERAWELVLAVLKRAPDDRLDVYAAGPLEELVRHQGTELVSVIEAEAARDERFRWALGCIWLQAKQLPADVLARIVRASGDAIKPFG